MNADDTATHESLTDELLAIRCMLGEPAAFDELVARWHEPLALYLRRLVGIDDAVDDLLQDSWLRILRSMPGLREPAKLRPWLFGIVRRVAMDRLRVRYGEAVFEQLAEQPLMIASGAADAEDAYVLREDLDSMHAEIARLPIPDRETLVLFHLHELSLLQIADVLAIPVGTVKSRLHRARTRLRDSLHDHRRNP